MNTKTDSAKVIGQTYERNRFEVQTRLYDTEKAQWGGWRADYCGAKTREEAEVTLAKVREWNRGLDSFIYCGRQEYRIVKVTATCEVVA